MSTNTDCIVIIQECVAAHFGVSVADILGSRRLRRIAFPRQIAMYLSRQMTNVTLTVIGEHFNQRDYSTVLYACRTVETQMEVDAKTRAALSALKEKVTARLEEKE